MDSMDTKISRRIFLKTGLSGAAILVLPVPLGCGDFSPFGTDENPSSGKDEKIGKPAEGSGRFFEPEQYETIQALTRFIIPEDKDPGAMSAGVVDYIDYLLGAFSVDPPRIFATGPYSGRHGGENGFEIYLPLSRVKEISWRNYIEGSKGIPEREFNGPVVGLQEIYTKGIEQLNALAKERFGKIFKELSPLEQRVVIRKADRRFIDTVFRNTGEGMYAAPEYGGNKDLVGWKYIDYQGDRQPIGYNREQVEESGEEGILSQEQLEEAEKFVRQLFAKKPTI